MKRKKWSKGALAVSLCLALLVTTIPATAFAFAHEDWVTGDGYGSITANADGTDTLKGDAELNSDNSHCGPYTKAGGTSLKDGDIVDTVDIFLNPNAMTAGEKFGLTVSINGTDGKYKTELLTNFWKGNENAIEAAVGLDSSFSAKIDKAGVYTLKFRYFDKAGDVYAQFSVENSGNIVASTGEINMNAKTADCGTRGYVWFSDISVNDGLRIGMPNVPSPLPEEQKAPVLLPADWTSGDGYGSVETKSENLAILKGEAGDPNSDNAHTGPFINTKGALLADGTVVDEVNVFLDPAKLTVGEKFGLTTGLNNTEDKYLTELLANFWKDNENGISVSVGLDPSFQAQLKDAGLYTFKYTFIPGETMVFGNFSIWKDGEKIASTKDILMPGASTDIAKGRRYVWFNDISVADGLEVYSVTAADYTKVDEALSKIPADLSVYTEDTVNAVNTAKNAVVRGKNVLEQTTVDGYATAIEDAIAALEYKDADYSKVDAAIAKANGLNKDLYKNFADVEAAVKAVVRGKNITEQKTVDGYAKAIEDAIAALEYKLPNRIGGAHREATSALISGMLFADDSAQAIVIVNGQQFPDALAATSFAHNVNAPILLVNGTTGDVNKTVLDEITRIDKDHDAKIYVIGGENAVKASSVDKIKALGYKDASIERIAGATRYETAIELAKKANNPKTVYIANGLNFPDALSIGSAAALNDGVILFTSPDELTTQTAKYLKEAKFENILIAGGEMAVSADVQTALKEICGNVDRISGENRVLTSVEVAKKYFPTTDVIFVATGEAFADALSGGPLAAQFNGPMLLINTNKNELEDKMVAYIKSSGAEKIVVLGGEAAVTPQLYQLLMDTIK